MEFIKHKFKSKENPSGIYKLVFDDKYFYIGSSVNLKSRMGDWRTRLLTLKYLRSINIKKILPNTDNVRFEIITILAKDGSVLRQHETDLLLKHWDDPYLLNRCPNATTPLGMRKYIGYVKKDKDIKPKSDYKPPCRRVALFSKNMELINIYPSITQISKYLKTSSDTVTKIFKGARGQMKKFIIKEVDILGNIIEPPLYTQPKKSFPIENKVNIIDVNGSIIKTCFNVEAVSKHLKCSETLIYRVLDPKKNNNSAKGYFLKLA